MHHFFEQWPDLEYLVFDLELSRFDLGDIQHVIYQGKQVIGALCHHAKLFCLLFVQGPGKFLEKDAGKSYDRVEGCAELVGHRGKKYGLEPVCRFGGLFCLFQFAGALIDDIFQVVAVFFQFPDCFLSLFLFGMNLLDHRLERTGEDSDLSCPPLSVSPGPVLRFPRSFHSHPSDS